MTTINAVNLEVSDPTAAARFYADAFGLTDEVRFSEAQEASSGFRGFTLSLTVSQPSIVDSYISSAVAAGASTLKAPSKSLWGYGGSVQAPDGAIWKVASSSKKDSGPTVRKFERMVLLLGVESVSATKRFYVERGLSVSKSFGPTYAELETSSGPVQLALYKRRALAKDAGVPAEGSGSHRLTILSDLGSFTDPDGFTWANG